MTSYFVIVEGQEGFTHKFDGEPQIDLTFEHADVVYKVTTRAHDEDAQTPSLHAVIV